MGEKELLREIEETSHMLYQNKEHEAMKKATGLLGTFQNMIKNQTQEQLALGGNFALVMLRELLEAYQNLDMLGMADCLREKAALFVQFYFQNTENA
ncbi:MAG: hypothetical protein J5986_01670 [Roseburia sp.]|nr:hypothetical protein [Roseburia sp.]